MSDIDENNQPETTVEDSKELVEQTVANESDTTGLVTTDESTVEQPIEAVEDIKLDIVLENSKLINYDVILEKFTDILTMTENQLMSNDVEKPRNIINIALEVFTTGANFCETSSTDDLYKFIAKNFEYLGIYLFTFSAENSIVGILTNKIDNLLYDYIGNQEDLLQQFNVFQANFKGEASHDLKSIVSPLIFNLSNIGTNIAVIKTIIHYIKLNEEKSTEAVLEEIILRIKNDSESVDDALSEESTH